MKSNSIAVQRYRDMIQGCYDRYSVAHCEAGEKDRIEMNLIQPGAQKNFTSLGFGKSRVPLKLMKDIKETYTRGTKIMEQWEKASIYTNHWSHPSHIVHLNTTMEHRIAEGVRPILEAWIGRSLSLTSVYGIRVYSHGSILAPHVDRLPLITSCIINVDQDVHEPWALEVYDHFGIAHNITIEPGEMILYESHSVIHGRPVPLNGSLYANVFVHFFPVDYEPAEHLEDDRFNFHPVDTEDLQSNDDEDDFNTLAIHTAAAQGKLSTLRKLLEIPGSLDLLEERDENGWQPLHEGVRSGMVDVVQYLVNQGADIGSTTYGGGSPLWWAKQLLHESSSVISFLNSIGAPDTTDEEL